MSLTIAFDSYPAVSPALSLTITSSPSLSAPLTIERVHQDGSRYSILLPSEPKLIAGSWVGVDRHIPTNDDFTYEATASDQSGSVSVPPVFSTEAWLVHPTEDDLAVLVDKVAAVGPRKRPSTAVGFQIHGARRPVFRNQGVRGPESGSLTIKCETPGSLDAAIAVLEDSGPLWLTTPHSGFEVRAIWLQPGDYEIVNPAGKDFFPYRHVVLPWVECRQPDEDATAIWTFDDLAAAFATFDAATAAYATFDKMTLDIRV